MPRNVHLALKAAASTAGVPESWADSTELAKLLQKESSFNFKSANPTSTAYGLFQFLDSTWAGTGVSKSWCLPGALYQGKSDINVEGVGRVPYWHFWQCVAGLRYIKNRKNYRTPAKAWAFWQQNGWY
jgi:hypothetical protein